MSLTKAFTASLLAAAMALAGACGGIEIKPVQTRTLVFQADKKINYGQLLPIDIIYVTYLHQLRDITAIGPNEWFDSDKRQMWAAKQSLSITGGQTITKDLDPVLVAKSPFIVVFTTFKGVDDPSRQQVVLDSQAKELEYINVHPHSLEPVNVFLRD